MKAAKQVFDLKGFKAVWGTDGIATDFVRQRMLDLDPDAAAEGLIDLLLNDSPVTILEQTAVTTGAAQTIDIVAPTYADPLMASGVRLVAVDINFQLNNFTLPKTDLNFEIQYLNGAGVVQASRTQRITGTASVQKGDTRQSMRCLIAEDAAVSSAAGVMASQNGFSMSLPYFRRPDAANIAVAAAALGLTTAQMTTVWPNLSTDVSIVRLNLPAGGFTAGVNITTSLVTAGRYEELAEIILSLDATGGLSDTTVVDAGMAGLIGTIKQA